ncbi:chaperone protein skp [Candidatus Blochmanniella vafra str. BVAF]|uniref:Chaperone protein Skp n=1 Tax=Blochmanniella vafra (strain BVAF) TaxID=859654 RepID=E8Q6T4_BLOVB|nr:OmpH family outer membrane protein [Candidatus Blochmannia vafer]ADV33681.1 chaperone protein skp [Candidatus Blochmannia vafer str. BVAF]
MKNQMYILGIMIWLIQINYVDASNKIAVVNIAHIFQQSSQRSESIKKLECEFKDRASELEMMEHDLQIKMQTLQRDGATMKEIDRNKLEKLLIAQRELFSNKAKVFQQDNHSRQTEERDKILDIIFTVVKNMAKRENYDIVIDTSSVVYFNSRIKDITNPVAKQVG